MTPNIQYDSTETMQDGRGRSQPTAVVRTKRHYSRPKAATAQKTISVALRKDTDIMGCGVSSPGSADRRVGKLPRDIRADLLCGHLDAYRPQRQRLVRIFVGSTFEDLEFERNALAERVYPKLRTFCRERGIEFQAVDLKFGLSRESYENLVTMESFIGEIKRCQQLSMGPQFLIFLSERLGERPIPKVIAADEFEKLKQIVPPEDQEYFTLWYRLDKNAIPPVYVLQHQLGAGRKLSMEERESGPNQENHDQQLTWLRLKIIALSALKKDRTLLHLAPLDLEIMNGIETDRGLWCHRAVEFQQTPSPTPVIGRRGFDNSLRGKNRATVANLSKFIDTGEDKELLESFKREHLNSRFGPFNILRYKTIWHNEYGIDPAKVPIQMHYIDIMCNQVGERIEHMIVPELIDKRDVGGSANPTLVDHEIRHHIGICRELCRKFVGREDLLKSVESYVAGNKRSPLVLYGAVGIGKTSLMAMATRYAHKWVPSKAAAVVAVRFLGTSPASSSLRKLLFSLSCQISDAYGQVNAISEELNDLVQLFPRILKLANDKRPLVIFLDSLCQLETCSSARRLSWLPIQLPSHVKLIVSTSLGDANNTIGDLKEYINDTSSLMEIPRLTESEIAELTRRWLAEKNRTLTARQWGIIITACKRFPYPLYVKLATNEAVNWKSYSPLQETWLEMTLKGVINVLFEKLECLYGRVLVSHMLGYLSVARFGLTENELEDILSLDDDVLNEVYGESVPSVRRVPPLLRIRICNDLGSYLTDHNVEGVLTKTWCDGQFRQIVHNRYLVDSPDKRRILHSNIADYFLGVWANGIKKPFVTNGEQVGKRDRLVASQPLMFLDGQPNTRKLVELPYHLLQSDRLGTLKVKALCNYEWLVTKMKVTSLSDVLEDFQMALYKFPDDEQLRTVEETLVLSRHALQEDTHNLASQLIGRITKIEGLEELIKQARWPSVPGLIPTLPFLTPPGNQMVHALSGHSAGVTTVDITQDGKYAATGSLDGCLNIWGVEDGILQISSLMTGKAIRKLKYANSDRLLVISHPDNISILEAETLVTLHMLSVRGLSGSAPPFALGGKGRKLAVIVRSGKLIVFDVAKGTVISEIKDGVLQRSCEEAKIDARCDLAAFFNPANRKKIVKLVNLTGKATVKSIKVSSREKGERRGAPDSSVNVISDVVVTSSRAVIVIGQHFNDVTIYDGNNLRLIKRVRGQSEYLQHTSLRYRFTCDDENLVFPVHDSIAVVDIADDDDNSTWYGMQHPTSVTGVASVDMRIFVTIATDNVMRVWDIAREEQTALMIRNSWESHKIMSKMDAYSREETPCVETEATSAEDSASILTSRDVQMDADDQATQPSAVQSLLESIQVLSDDLFYTEYSQHPSERPHETIQQIEPIPGNCSYVLVKSKKEHYYFITIWNLSALHPVRRSVLYRSRHRNSIFEDMKLVSLNGAVMLVTVETRILLVDFVKCQVLRVLDGTFANENVALTNNRHRLTAITESREQIVLHDLKSGNTEQLSTDDNSKVSAITSQADGCGKVVVSQHHVGDKIVCHVWCTNRCVRLHTLDAGDVSTAAQRPSLTRDFLLSGDSRYLCFSQRSDHVVVVWNLQTGQLARQLMAPEKWRRIKSCTAVGAHGLLVGYDNGQILLWELTEGRIVHTLADHSSPPIIIKSSQDGLRALSMTECSSHGARDERRLILWDLVKGCKLATYHVEYTQCKMYKAETVHLLFNGNLIVLPANSIGSPLTMKLQGRYMPSFEVPVPWPTPYEVIDDETLLDFSLALGKDENDLVVTVNENRNDDIKDGGE
ncbi:NACHT and WD repeat domain-containing protein 2-like [Ptychodera flava]|uniref:NACHT and WD repeat domain-containing protein 2-like n=1 Tax=Ptychodera flava TaxID=63121 RepID=UPI003969E0F7